MSASMAGAALVFILLFLIESKRPWRSPRRDIPRIRTNLVLLVLGFVSMSTLVPVGFGLIFKVLGPLKGTLLDLITTSFLVKAIAGILVFDLKNYAFHRVIHKVRWLWKFHRTHHSDPTVDIFTTQRFHPVELLFGFIPALIPIFVGIPLMATLFLDAFALPWVLLQHSNIAFPPRLEKYLSYIFLTPRLHKIHHSIDPEDANVNFGIIFSFWDRIFGTYRSKSEQEMEALSFGARGPFTPHQTQGLLSLLILPFLPEAQEQESIEEVKR